MNEIEKLNSIDSEGGIIATLIHHPDYYFYSERLLPNHFTSKSNRIVYTAISMLVSRGINTVDPYNILEILGLEEGTRGFLNEITLDKLQELMNMSEVLARHSVEEYKVLVGNVMDVAFRKDAYQNLKDCMTLCLRRDEANIQQKIYSKIDEVMTSYSSTEDIPSYAEVIEENWEEIKSRQGEGYTGIPFKFPTLNEYVTIERGELVVFAAEAKQGKSMLLLNCAIDLLKKTKPFCT